MGLCDIPDLTEVERTSEETCILSSAIGKLEELCTIPNDNEVEICNIPNDNEVQPTSDEETCILRSAIGKLEELCNIPNDDSKVEQTSSEDACILRSAIGKLEELCIIPNDNEVELSNIPNDNEVEPTWGETFILRSAIGRLEELCTIPNDNDVELTSGDTRILSSAIVKLEELCNIPKENEVEPTSGETCILSSAIGKLEELCNIPDLSEVETASEEVSHVSRDELEQGAKQEELMKLIYEKEKRMMEKILKKVESSSYNNHEDEAFSHQLQMVIKDSISKYFQSISGGTTSSSSEEGQCSGLKLSLPWRLQLRNNWQQCKEEKPIIYDLKAAGDNRLEMELPMMVGCYQYHLLINGVAFCDRGRPYRRDDEDFGDFVNFFTLWSETPLPTWPGLRMSTKLDFPFKVELSGSWGEQVVECMMNPDGTLGAHLPSLCPGVYHYHFLINGQQFCDKSRSYQQYFFGCYNLLKLSNSGIVELNYTSEKPSTTELTPFPDELVSSCISILELLDQQFKEWEHPSKLSDRFKLSEDQEPAAKRCPQVEEPKTRKQLKCGQTKMRMTRVMIPSENEEGAKR